MCHLCFIVMTGAGIDGVEEIKRHPFFVTIDWNVSCMSQRLTDTEKGAWEEVAAWQLYSSSFKTEPPVGRELSGPLEWMACKRYRL